MDPYARLNSYWDIAQQPTSFSTLPDDDFLALLQKQFPTTVGTQPKPFDVAPDAVDPQAISSFSLPNPSPPSSDSSPSPPSAVDAAPSSSRRHSDSFNPSSAPDPVSPTSPTTIEELLEDGRLKRKASDEDMDDEPTHKNPHTNNSKKASSSRRKSTGNPQQDEYRLLKRKEQNRAAQRAFRERKEKHVKDLEDKLSEMEAKNQAATSENENLRDLLARLQQENMALKSGTFDFRVPKSTNPSASPSSFATTPTANENHTPFTATSPIASSSKSASVPPEAPGPQFDFNFGSLIPFDPAVLTMLDESQPTATDGAMNMDFGFGPMNGVSQYRTLASDPTSMSFAEPMPYDMGTPSSIGGSSLNGMDSLGFASFGAWSPPPPSDNGSIGNHSMDSLDQLFGGNYMGAQSPVDFSALLRSPPSSISPVSHSQSIRSNSNNPGASAADTPNSTPGATTSSSASPSLSSSSAPPATPLVGLSCPGSDGGGCPKTKEDVKKVVDAMGPSQFVEDGAVSATSSGFVKKAADPIMGQMVMCKGSSFPKTEQSDKNIEVLTAWRSITSDPQFKDVDINDLCQEFTSKARCDGTKVVLEPEGVHHIIETLAARRQQLQNKQSPGQPSPASSQN